MPAGVIGHRRGAPAGPRLWRHRRPGADRAPTGARADRSIGPAPAHGVPAQWWVVPEAHRARPIQKLLRTPLAPLLLRLFNQRSFGRSFSTIFGAGTRPDAADIGRFWSLIEHNGGRANMGRLLHYIGERKRHRQRWVDALVEAPMPMRLIVGMDDPVSGAHMAERYRALVPRADVVELPGIGHYPQWEAAERVAEATAEFAR